MYDGVFAACIDSQADVGRRISITKLLVVAALIILVFGTKNMHRWAATGVGYQGFKKAMNEDDDSAKKTTAEEAPAQKLSKSNSPAASPDGMLAVRRRGRDVYRCGLCRFLSTPREKMQLTVTDRRNG